MKTMKQLQEELEMLASGRAFLEEAKTTIEIPTNATNGDVMKAVFSVKSWEFRTSTTMSVQFEDFCEIKLFPLDWWNAPYKKGDK